MDKQIRIISPDPVAEKSGIVKIQMHKNHCRQFNSKDETVPMLNVMTIPGNVKIGDFDLSGGKICPKTMYEDWENSNMYIGEYDRAYLYENAIKVSFVEDGEYKDVLVDIDELKKVIDNYNLSHEKGVVQKVVGCVHVAEEEFQY